LTVMVPAARFLLMVWFDVIPTTRVPVFGVSTTVLVPAGAVIGPLQAPPLTAMEAPPLSENWNTCPAMPLAADLQISIVPGALRAHACDGVAHGVTTIKASTADTNDSD